MLVCFYINIKIENVSSNRNNYLNETYQLWIICELFHQMWIVTSNFNQKYFQPKWVKNDLIRIMGSGGFALSSHEGVLKMTSGCLSQIQFKFFHDKKLSSLSNRNHNPKTFPKAPSDKVSENHAQPRAKS